MIKRYEIRPRRRKGGAEGAPDDLAPEIGDEE
jgi:hypothetical protein